MSRTLLLALAAILAADARAQSDRNSEPRTPRPLPVPTDAKFTAESVQPTPARTRDARSPATSKRTTPIGDGTRTTRVDPRVPDELRFSAEADGAIWVRGRTYKARFGPGGATYIPFLGSRAPRNFPVDLSLTAASVDGDPLALAPVERAVRDGDRIVIDRGPVDEVYELALDHVEQTFLVSERPAHGALKLVVGLHSDLARAETAHGIELSNEFGAVRYGRAFVRESNGVQVPVASRLAAGGVEIELDAAFVAAARFPLVIDPMVSTFAVDENFPVDHFDPDTAYDVTTDRYLIVYEEVFSIADHDVFAQTRGANGTFAAGAYLDISTENWTGPQCAGLNSADQFLCAAQVGGAIRGRTIGAANFGLGAKFDISTPDASGSKVLADVGGDPYGFSGTDVAYYCVVWQRDFSASDTDIHARLVRPNSSLVGTGTLMIDNSAGSLDQRPSISKSNGQLGSAAAWTIAWHRALSTSDYDVRFARLAWDGTILTPSTPLASSSALESFARASSPLDDGRVLVTWSVDEGTDHDVHYAVLAGATVETSGNLGELEALPTLRHDQIDSSVDSDGQRFVVAYSENFTDGAGDYRTWLSAFAPFGGALECVEAQQWLDAHTSLHADVVSTWSGGGAAARSFAVWDKRDVNDQGDIRGTLYDRPLGGGRVLFCPGDGSAMHCPCSNDGVAPRGCGNSVHTNGALLSSTLDAQTGSADTMTFWAGDMPANVSCTLFQGTTGASTTAFGDGLRCVGGTQVRIRTKLADWNGTAGWPTGGEPSVSAAGAVPLAGAVRYYQVTYRNAASFCTPATFNITNGVRVLWLP